METCDTGLLVQFANFSIEADSIDVPYGDIDEPPLIPSATGRLAAVRNNFIYISTGVHTGWVGVRLQVLDEGEAFQRSFLDGGEYEEHEMSCSGGVLILHSFTSEDPLGLEVAAGAYLVSVEARGRAHRDVVVGDAHERYVVTWRPVPRSRAQHAELSPA